MNNSIIKYHDFWKGIELHRDVNEYKYIFMLILTSGFFFVKLILGLSINSMLLQVSVLNVLYDILSLSIGYSSLKMKKYNSNSKITHSYLRCEIIMTLMNSIFILGVCFSLFLKVIYILCIFNLNKILDEGVVSLVTISSIGFVINFLGLFLFDINNSNNDRHIVNKKTIYFDIAGDLLLSFITLISSIIIICTSGYVRYLIDSLSSIILLIIISYNSFIIVRKSIYILLNVIPIKMNYNKIINEILKIDGVISQDKLNIWSLNKNNYFGSIHIRINRIINIDKIIGDVEEVFYTFGIDNITIQPNLDNNDDEEKIN
jgi:cobalt-zinc-cadmium efflux system protein